MPLNESQRQWLAIFAGTACCLGALAYTVHAELAPALAEKIAVALPPDIVDAVGASTLAALDQSTLRPTGLSPDAVEVLRQRLSPLLRQARPAPATAQLHFRDWPQTANALALPGGHIVLTDQLVRLLSAEQQIESVVLHELGHLVHRHPERAAIQQVLYRIGLTVLLGDFSAAGSLLAEALGQISLLAHSRAFENAADEYASEQMLTRYGSVQPLVDALQTLQDSDQNESTDRGLDWIATHPATADRISRIRAISSRQVRADSD